MDMVSMILVCDSFCEILTAQSPGLIQPAGYDARFRKSAASDGMLTLIAGSVQKNSFNQYMLLAVSMECGRWAGVEQPEEVTVVG